MLGQAYLDADPSAEDAVAGLLQAYRKMNERGQIKKVYDKVTKLFREELGLEPGPEIVAIYEESMGFKRS